MRRRRYVRTVILAIGVIALLALMAQGVLARPPRPAATGPSPEEVQLKQLPAPAQQVGRPSKGDLLARCQQRPNCRTTLDAAKKGQQATTADKAPAPVSVYLTPQNPYVAAPYSYLSLYAVSYAGNYSFSSKHSTANTSSENKPYVFINFKAPAAGWYIIDHRAGHAAAKLRHQFSGPIIETWDTGTAPCSGGICDYATMEYLEKGFHVFYFYSPTHSYHFYSVSIESYP